MRIKIRLLMFALLMPLFSWGITVKIENVKLNIKGQNSSGQDAITVFCELNVSGIQGKNFDLVAIVQDDEKNWHKDSYGNTVKSHRTLNATYENSRWDEIGVALTYSKLAPKPGNHNYKVYLYVYYNNNWYGGAYAGSYNQTGSSSSTSTSNSRASNSDKYSEEYVKQKDVTFTCTSCGGSGLINCFLCGGLGGMNQYRYLPYPPFTSYTEWVSCSNCFGQKKIKCQWCGGKGTITYNINKYADHFNNPNNLNINSGNSYNNSNSYNNNSSNGSSSAYTTCRICGGSGVCTSCNGKGGSWQDTGYYIGEDSQSWINCGSCNGSKRCFNCYGTGRQ